MHLNTTLMEDEPIQHLAKVPSTPVSKIANSIKNQYEMDNKCQNFNFLNISYKFRLTLGQRLLHLVQLPMSLTVKGEG